MNMGIDRFILKAFVILGAYLIFSSSSCNDYCHKEVVFEVPVTISPVREVYHSGDTIWVDIKIGDVLEDRISGDSITVGYFDFEIGFVLDQYFADHFIDAIEKFDFYFETGSHIIFGGIYKQSRLKFDIVNDTHDQRIRYGIIIGDITGDYGIYFGSNQNTGTGVKSFPEDNCDYVFEMKFLTNGGSTENIEKYIAKYPSMPEYLGTGFTVEKFRGIGTYFFTVE